jgi:MEMO1 family protein
MKPLPALRPVDAYPIEHEGRQFFCLYDPSDIIDERLILTPPGIFVASQLDGAVGVVEVREAFRRQFDGLTIRAEQVLEVVEFLDAKGFLETDAFESIRASVIRGFLDSPVRPAYHAGKSYPGEPGELRDFLDAQFTRPGGPGGRPMSPPDAPPLPGAVIPHIDYHRGGHVYAHGYAEMLRHGRPKTVVIFGVAHAAEPVPFILSRKAFETPCGTVETDRNWVDRVTESCSWDPFAFEFTQRAEHSIEFHAAMLAHLYGPETRIVPILCSMFGEDLHADRPADEEPIQRFLRACRNAAADPDDRVSVIASADLAHVGRCFGDDFDIDAGRIAEIQARDDEDLAHILANDPEAWYESVMNDRNARRVCGINCIYSAMKTLEGRIGRAETLAYDAAPDPSGGIVSFASLALK